MVQVMVGREIARLVEIILVNTYCSYLLFPAFILLLTANKSLVFFF